MPDRLVIDADVLIDFTRGLADATTHMRGLRSRPSVWAVTLAELYVGIREGEERVALERFITLSVVVDVDAQISTRGGLFRRQYGKSHGVGLADAIVAATAEAENAKVVTLNRKHYPIFDDVIVPYTKP